MIINEKYNPELNLYRFTNEKVEKKKLYKSGKSWVIGSATLFVFLSLGTTGVFADTNSTPVSATVPAQVEKNVNQNTNSEVPTTQTSKVLTNDSTSQEQLSDSKTPVTSAHSESQTTSTQLSQENPSTQSTVGEIAPESNEVPVQKNVVENESGVKTTDGVVDGYKVTDKDASQKAINNDINSSPVLNSNDSVNDDKSVNVADKNSVDQQRSDIEQTAKPSQNNVTLQNANKFTNFSTVQNVKVDESQLQNAIDQAKANGIIVNVNNKTVNVISSDLDATQRAIQAHYASEVDYIMANEKDYQEALTKANDDYNQAMAKYNADKAANNEANAKIDQENDQATQNYANQLTQYDNDWSAYQNKIDKMKKPGQVDPNQITNNLQLGGAYQNKTDIQISNTDFDVWEGTEDGTQDPNQTGWKTNPPEEAGDFGGVPLDWRHEGENIHMIYLKNHDTLNNVADDGKVTYNNVGTITVSGLDPNTNYYKNPITGEKVGITKWSGKINSIQGWGKGVPQLWLNGSIGVMNGFNIDSIDITNTLYDVNGNPVDFSAGGAYLSSNEDASLMKNDLSVNSGNSPTDGDWHWYNAPRSWDNWSIDGPYVLRKMSIQYQNGIEGHSIVGGSVYDHGDGLYTADQMNSTIMGPYNKDGRDNSVLSDNPNNPEWNQTTNHTAGGEDNNAFTASMGYLTGTDFNMNISMVFQNNSFKNISYGLDSSIPKAGWLNPPIKPTAPTLQLQIPFDEKEPTKAEVPVPTIDVDTTDIKTITPTPSKKVVDASGKDVNGKNTIDGSTLAYQVDWDLTGLKDIQLQPDDIAKGMSITDNYDSKTTADQETLKVIDSNGNDITDQTNVTWGNHQWTVSAKNAQDFYNKFSGQSLRVDFSTIVNQGSTGDISNSATQQTFGNSDKTNTVIDHVFVPAPSKIVKNQNGQDINGKTVQRGDTVDYNITWDLTGLKDFYASKNQLEKGLSISDDYGTAVSPDKSLTKIKDESGNDITNQVDITWDDAHHTFVVNAKDPQNFVDKFGGQKLTIDFPTTVMGDGNGDISNQATQNTFGNSSKTNIVVTHEPKMNPKKDVVIDAGSNDSMNGQNIPIGESFDYKLPSSVRPANYGGNTNEWSVSDTIPSQDRATGQWQVYASSKITLLDGTVIESGTDISKYFTFNLDRNNGKISISANKDFLDIINSDINKKDGISWDAYFQAKRIAYGTNITNIAEESYNHQIMNTNEVKTNTPEPEKPIEPITPETPSTQKTPETSQVPEKAAIPNTSQPSVAQIVKDIVKDQVQATPEPEKRSVQQVVKNVVENINTPQEQQPKDSLPQTGQANNNEIKTAGIIMLLISGIIAILGLFGFRRKINKNH